MEKINQRVHQWKISFNPDPNKQATKVLFSPKVDSDVHHKLTFSGNQIRRCSSQKHLGLILDNKLDFSKHLDEKINKCNKITEMMKKLSLSAFRQSLLTIYKSFVRPILDSADIIYDKPHKDSFKGTSRELLYQELGLESLKQKMASETVFFL